MEISRQQKLFIYLTAVFVVALVVGDIVGGKICGFKLFGTEITVSAGMIPFPITFLLTDLLNEFYGKKAARFVTWVGFFMAAFAFITLAIGVALPWAPAALAPGWKGMNRPSFNNIFGGSQRILIASMCAYLTAQFVDIFVFHLLKRLTRNRLLWLRATGSTVASQLIDTTVILTIAFWGVMTPGQIIKLGASQYVIKLAVAIGLTPAIYAGHAVVEKLLGIEPVKLGDEESADAS